MTRSIVLTDELLVQALTKRANHPQPPALLDRVVNAAASTAQEPAARRLLPWGSGGAGLFGGAWLSAPALVTALALAIALTLLVAALRAPVGPAATPTPTQPVLAPSPARSAGPSTTPTEAPPSTPQLTLLLVLRAFASGSPTARR